MPGRVAHIAINTDDDDATRAFYEGLFDWRFEPYFPGFVRTVLPAATEVVAAVQTRRELLPGVRTNGPEVTIEVDDLVMSSPGSSRWAGASSWSAPRSRRSVT